MDFDFPEKFSAERLRELFESAGQDQEEFFRYLDHVSSKLGQSKKDLVVPIYALWSIGYSAEAAIEFMSRQEPMD